MSFFDEGDEPRTARTARPRRGGPPPRRPADQQIVARRAVAGGIVLVIVLVLFFGIRGCLSTAKKNGLRDYNQDVSALASESEEVTGQFFQELTREGNPVDKETQLNQLRVRADQIADRGRDLDTPDEMRAAQQHLVLSLDFRAGAVGRVASRVRTALSSEESAAEQATSQIAAQMQQLLASDVIWSQRVAAFVREALDENDVTGQRVVNSRVFTDLGWLDPAQVAERVGGEGGGGDDGGQRGEPAPGTHGHGLAQVAVGETRLQPAPAANRTPASSGLTFDVQFQNQGENDEEDVRVNVTLDPESGRTIRVGRSVDQTTAGANVDVSIPLGQAPPIGQAVTVTVEVRRVPGEEMVENNKQEYTVLFTR